MPVAGGLGRTTDLLPTHTSQLPEHGIASAFASPLLNTVAMSATTIGQAVGAITSSTSNLPPTLPIPASMAAPSKQLPGSRPDVVCPLPNLDGSACRKKCSGTFAYRSICEHIRRAHPEHWIPKLPASAESFHKMIQTPPAPRGAALYEGPNGAGGAQSTISGAVSRRATTGSGARSRAKVPKSKSSSDDQDLVEGMSSQSSAAESDSRVTTPTLAESKEMFAHEVPQQGVPSETDTESDHPHSPVSPPSLSVLSTPVLPMQSSKTSSVTKSKPASRKKPSTSAGSKTKSSPRKITARRRTIDKKVSGNALTALYSTPVTSHPGLNSLGSGTEMMDIDTEATPRQHYVYSHGNGDFRNGSRHETGGDEMDPDEVGLILGGMSKAQQHVHTAYHGAPQLRRAYSFSVGDNNGPTGPVAVGGRANRGLSINTNLAYEYDRRDMRGGSMSAGGDVSSGGSRWDDLLEAAVAAAEANNVPERKSPLLYQSVHPQVYGESSTPRRNMNPYGPDLSAPLKMMIDVATAEADSNQVHRQQQYIQNQHHAHPQNYMQNYVHNQHRYTPQPNVYQLSQYMSHPYQNYSRHSTNHTNISPILNGTSLASLNSSNTTSHASTPAYSKPSSPRVESMQYSPKIQCSLCRVHVDISMALACTECINGFCHGCVPSSESSELDGEGLGGMSSMSLKASPELELQSGDHPSKKRAVCMATNQGTKCGVCGVTGARYKPVRLIVHV